MNGRGIQESAELNGRGPKNEASNQRGVKIKPWIESAVKIFVSGQNDH